MFENIRNKFPFFEKNPELIFLDTAASALKPKSVIECINNCYSYEYTNVHRGVYKLSTDLTERFENVRFKTSKYINAESEDNIVFTKSATEAINLVASCFSEKYLDSGDEVLLSYLEHHANIVPWQLAAKKRGFKIITININNEGQLDYDDLIKKVNKKTKFISITHMSNVLGTIVDMQIIRDQAKRYNIPFLIDGCQYIAHAPVDIKSLGCDFYVFSGHKLYGPTGIGVLYGKKKYLDNMPPYQTGGEMISSVTLEKTEFDDIPYKFEAGTPNIAGAIGFAKAIDYLEGIGMNSLHSHEQALFGKAKEALSDLGDLQFVGDAQQAGALISFNLKDVHAHDLASLLDREGIALRAGHHCSQPTMDRFHVNSTARISFGLYNNDHDIQRLIESIAKAKKILS